MKTKKCFRCGAVLGKSKVKYCSNACGNKDRYTIFIPNTMIDNEDLFNREIFNRAERIEIVRVSLSLRDRDE